MNGAPRLSPDQPCLDSVQARTRAVIARLAEQPDTRAASWCVPPATGWLLYSLALGSRAVRIVEVGTSIGFSTLHLALAAVENAAFSGQTARVFALDASENRLSQAQAHFEEAGLAEWMTPLAGDALNTLAERQAAWREAPLDLVFLDARKSDYLAYWRLLAPCLRPGGWLVADNTVSHRAQMQDFIDAMRSSESATGWQSREITAPDSAPQGLLLAQKPCPHP